MTTSVTYTFSNATTADATQVNQNFTDVLAGLNGVDKLTTRGDLLTRNATVYSRLAVGAAGKSMITDGTDPTWGWAPVIVAKSADYTVTDTDGVESIWMTTAASNRTVTLPTAADNTNRRIIITKADSGAGTCIIDGEGAETVNGATTVTLLLQYQAVTVHCNGTAWLLYSVSYPSARNIVGDITGTTVPTGYIGQRIDGTAQTGAMTTGVVYNMSSMSLTPGVWMMYGIGYVGTTGAPGANSYVDISISATSATYDTTCFQRLPISLVSGNDVYTPVPPRYQLVTATTTYYLVEALTFTTSTHSRGAATIFYGIRIA